MTVLLRDAATGKWRLHERPVDVVVAHTLDEVLPALERIEGECAGHRRYAAGRMRPWPT